MLKPRRSFKSLSSNPSSQWICLACRSKSQWQYRRASTSSPAPKALPPQKKNVFELEKPPLHPLNRVIGVDEPPKVGQNPAKDLRPWSERWHAHWEQDAHKERRRKILNDLKRPYYRDWRRMRYNDGKTFIAPETPFKIDVAKYFPNFQGYTLADSWSYLDTAKVLRGNISIVSFASLSWAESQVKSFVGKKENPKLMSLLEEFKDGGLQQVSINYEDEFFKKILIYLFLWYGRRKNDREYGRDMRARSFIVTRGVDREFFENNLGVTNLRVGYVYLVDQSCKIRWVGNGDATDGERASLVKVARRLVKERKAALEKKQPAKRKAVEKRENAPTPLAAMMV